MTSFHLWEKSVAPPKLFNVRKIEVLFCMTARGPGFYNLLLTTQEYSPEQGSGEDDLATFWVHNLHARVLCVVCHWSLPVRSNEFQ